MVPPAWLLPVSLLPYRLLAVGWSRLGRHSARPVCRGLNLRSPLLTCARWYRGTPTGGNEAKGCLTVWRVWVSWA